MILFPNAKINIGLSVLERRNDGYHNIETLYFPVGLFDILEFAESESKRNTLDISGIYPYERTEKNLVLKAWEIMYEKFEIPHVHIHLHKSIPAGAGLGGGSSDAAFMLKGLNELFQCNCSETELREMASSLGSDCSFFVMNKAARGTGRGELLETIDHPLKGFIVLLVNPGIHISSKDAYSGIVPKQADESLKDLITNPPDSWKDSIYNAFEATVFSKYPVIQKIKSDLYDMGAVYASMTGSGSTVFGLFREVDKEEQASYFGNYFNASVELM
ncbi:MAG: 4-(cytidine 5'-diphospho)-2-C-methyl-D-erythritol kinase [Bacteroidales bacterium]|jgi:4-diphosphocytidyl-2-C-methyl-D-erythritol kinase